MGCPRETNHLPVPAAKRSSQSRRRAISWPRSSGGTLHPRSVVRWSPLGHRADCTDGAWDALPPQSASGFGEHVDDLAGHRVHDQNPLLELEIGVALEDGHLVAQRQRQRIRLQPRRKLRAHGRIEALRGLCGLELERDLGVLGAQDLPDLGALIVSQIERRQHRVLRDRWWTDWTVSVLDAAYHREPTVAIIARRCMAH